MTPEFLTLLIQQYPNSYELGDMIRKFHYLYKENELTLGTKEIEQLFIERYFNKRIHFQKAK
jgi:hypothetical protein